MKAFIPQLLATRGLLGGSPQSIATGGLVPARARFRFLGVRKTTGPDGAVVYERQFGSLTSAAPSDLVVGEYYDDKTVLEGTAV